jgi:hypothetical protein
MSNIRKNMLPLAIVVSISLSLFSKTTYADETSPIHFYKAIYAANRNAMTAERGVFIVGEKKTIDAARPSPEEAIKSGKAQLFSMARYDAFMIEDEKAITSNRPSYYLLSPYQKPCVVPSVSSVSLSTFNNGAINAQYNSLWLKGCTTDTRNYSSLVLAGTDIKEVSRIIPDAIETPTTKTYEPIQVAPGSPPSLVNNVRKMNEELEKQFKEGKLTPPNPRSNQVQLPPHTIYASNPKTKYLVDMALTDARLKAYKPSYFISSHNRAFVLFVPARSSSDDTAKLTELNHNNLNYVFF